MQKTIFLYKFIAFMFLPSTVTALSSWSCKISLFVQEISKKTAVFSGEGVTEDFILPFCGLSKKQL